MNQNYQIHGKLNAFDQLLIARKLAPAMALVEGVVHENNADKDLSILTVMALSYLSDPDSDIVVNKCLSLIVRIQDGVPPTKLIVQGTLQFSDLTMKDLLDITAEVIKANLGDFLNTALPSLRQAVAEPNLQQ